MKIEQNEKRRLIWKIRDILINESDVLFAYLHGSFISQEEFNDIDIALYLDEKIMKEIRPIDFEITLALELEKSLRMPVDIKLLNFAPLGFRYHVSYGHLLFSRVELKREEFLCKTWGEYFDFQPVAEIYLKEVLSAQI